MPKLTTNERDAFLQERGHLARIATLHPDGGPSVADFAIYGVFRPGLTSATPDCAEVVSRRSALTDWYERGEEATRY